MIRLNKYSGKFLVIFLIVLIVPGSLFAANTTTIQIGFPLSEGTVTYEAAAKFKQIVEDKSNGTIKIEIFPGGQLGKDVEVLEGLRFGTHDATIIATPITTVEPRFGFFDLPYLFTNREDVEKITKGEIGKELLEGLGAKGIVGLAYWVNGWRQITNNIRPIKTPDDLKGMKIRTPSSPSRLELFRLLGANPTVLSYGEVFSALQQGVIDGQENPLYAIISAGFYQVQKYLSFTNHVYANTYMLFSKQLWDTFSEDTKKILKDTAIEVGESTWDIYEALQKKSLDKIKETKIEITPTSEIDIAAFKEKATPLYKNPKFVKPIGNELMDRVLNALER